MFTNNKLSKSDLGQFMGTENFYRHFTKNLVYTDGIKFLAEKGKCYWLIDEIAFAIPELLKKHRSWFYTIDFEVSKSKTAHIIFTDGNDLQVLQNNIQWTDFPLIEEKITLFLCKGELGYCLMLSIEY